MKKPAGLRWKPWRRNRVLVWIRQAESEQPTPLCGGGRTASLPKVALTRCSRVRTREGKLIYKPTRGEGSAVLAHFGSNDVWCSNHSLWSVSQQIGQETDCENREGTGTIQYPVQQAQPPFFTSTFWFCTYKRQRSNLSGERTKNSDCPSPHRAGCKTKMTWTK